MWRILLVEDNPADVRLVREALKASQLLCQVTAVENGEKALTLLRREAREIDAPRPNLILLDLNLPRMSGHTVLALLKTDPMLYRLPVVVLTTSRSKEDEKQAYQLGAAHFLVKPDTWAGYQEIASVIGSLCAGEQP
jgi:two-component system, chemotaxis family, response regulator Rcp1